MRQGGNDIASADDVKQETSEAAVYENFHKIGKDKIRSVA